MTIVQPPGSLLNGFPYRLRPYNNVTPFTYQDGLTYLEVLEELRGWLAKDLIDYLGKEIGGLIKVVNVLLENLDTVTGDVSEKLEIIKALVETVEEIRDAVSGDRTAVEEILVTVRSLLVATEEARDRAEAAAIANELAFERKGVPISILSFGAKITTDAEAFDSSKAFEDAFAYQKDASVGQPRDIYVPPGLFYISRRIIIPANTRVFAYGSTVKLAAMARSWMFATDGAINNGVVSWNGGTLDGNDANQGDWEQGGNGFDVSKGLVGLNCDSFEINDLTVRRVRGHSINHWGNRRVKARNLTFDQGIDPTSPSGGRRRDGITGSSLVVDIDGVQGYTGDDMVAVVAGAEWGPLGNAGRINTESIRIRNVRPGLSKQDSTRRTWRGVAIYTRNGYGHRYVNIDDVQGDTTLSHVAILENSDATTTTGGYISDAYVSRVSGTNHSSTDFGTFIFVSGTSVKHLSIDGIYHRASALMTLPTVRVRSAAVVSFMFATNVYTDDANNPPTVNIFDGGSVLNMRVGTLITTATSNVVTRSATATGGTSVTGVVSTLLSGAGFTRTEAFTPGNGVDANTLIEAGTYVTTAAANNWPRAAEASGQQMIVTRNGARIQQTVSVMLGTVAALYVRASSDTGATWLAWARVLAP